MNSSIINEISRSIELNNRNLNSTDITVCLVVRLTPINLWVLDRLESILDFYKPSPRFLIMDLGSDDYYSKKIEDVCSKSKSKVDYQYLNYKGTFSASIGRNACLKFIKTDLMFFTDVDIVHYKSFFGFLATLASDLEISTAVRRCLFMPVYHLSEIATNKFSNLTEDLKSNYLRELSYLGQGSEFNSVFDFVAPYSNVFLIHKSFFDFSGGYSDEFNKYGSEDFEFLIRLGILATDIPFSENFNEDLYRPTKDDFWKRDRYRGFRRYLEVMTSMSESLGLSAYHLWHEKPSDKGYWTEDNDNNRETLRQVLDLYYPDINNTISIDYHERESKALCLAIDETKWKYFLPLRLMGYKLEYIAENKVDDFHLSQILLDVRNFKYKKVFVLFSSFLGIREELLKIAAEKKAIEIVFVQAGVFFESLDYFDIKNNKDKDWANFPFKNKMLSEKLLLELKNKECNDSFFLNKMYEQVVFLNFKNWQNILNKTNFSRKIIDMIKINSGFLFLIKKEVALYFPSEIEDMKNIMVIKENSDIHFIIKNSTAVITDDDLDVEILSIVYEKKILFYSKSYLTDRSSFFQFTTPFDFNIYLQNETPPVTNEKLVKAIDYLIFNKYSWFSYGSTNSMLEIICLGSLKYNCGMRSMYSYHEKSYLSWKNNLYYSRNKSHIKVGGFKKISIFIAFLFLSERKFNKFKRSPKKFFEDSKKPLVRFLVKFFK